MIFFCITTFSKCYSSLLFYTQIYIQYFSNQTSLEMKCIMFHYFHRNLRNKVHVALLSIRILITIVTQKRYDTRGEVNFLPM